MKNKKIFGFTIAEMLIALGVIGVVTFLLMSVFSSNSNAAWQKSKDYKLGIIKYDKIYNAINYSFNQQLMKNNNVSNLRNILEVALNTLNTTCTGSSCAARVSSDKGGYNTRISDLSRKLADNSELTVYSKTAGRVTEYAVFVDTNGKEKPNRVGRDILPVYIDNAGNVINVNPKTGQKFDKLAQKKYDSSKTYRFQCPNEDTVLTLAKNSKTGLYEAQGGQKCNKICKVDYAQKVFGHNLGDVNPISYDATGKKLIYDGNPYLKYFATYAPLTCFSNLDHSCKQAGALYYFKEEMKKKYGFEGAGHTVDETNKIVTAYDSANKYVEYKASYNKDCNPTFDSNYPKCTQAGALNTYNQKWASKCSTPSISGDTVTCEKSESYYDYTYTIKYNQQTCALVSSDNSKVCSKANAKKKLAADKGIAENTISLSGSTFSYETSDATYTYTYNQSSCYTGGSCTSKYNCSDIRTYANSAIDATNSAYENAKVSEALKGMYFRSSRAQYAIASVLWSNAAQSYKDTYNSNYNAICNLKDKCPCASTVLSRLESYADASAELASLAAAQGFCAVKSCKNVVLVTLVNALKDAQSNRSSALSNLNSAINSCSSSSACP